MTCPRPARQVSPRNFELEGRPVVGRAPSAVLPGPMDWACCSGAPGERPSLPQEAGGAGIR